MNNSLIWIDFTLIGVIGFFLVNGLLRGLGKEVFSLGFWILASWVGLTFNREFSIFLESTISHPSARMAASFIALFSITLSLGGLISFLMRVVTKQTSLSFMSRFGGLFFGTVRGLVVVAVMVILAGLTTLPKNTWWAASTVLPPFQLLAVGLRDHLSLGIAETISYR